MTNTSDVYMDKNDGTTKSNTNNEKTASKKTISCNRNGKKEAAELFRLGHLHLFGSRKEGVLKDRDRGMDYLEQAAKAGHGRAAYLLADCYSKSNPFVSSTKDLEEDGAVTLKPQKDSSDLSKAFRLYEQAAQAGEVNAMWRLGLCYHYGNGVDPNGTEAIEWFQKAAEEYGHPKSLRFLAVSYMYGHNMPGGQDYEKGFAFLQRALKAMGRQKRKQDHVLLYHLAWAYLCGYGTDVSVQKSIHYLRRAIKTNKEDTSSLFLLASIKSASLDPHDLIEAQKLIERIPSNSRWYRQAAWLQVFIKDQQQLFETSCCQLVPAKYGGGPAEKNAQLEPDFFRDADIQLIALIGSGQFGKVYLARRSQAKGMPTTFKNTRDQDNGPSRGKHLSMIIWNRVLVVIALLDFAAAWMHQSLWYQARSTGTLATTLAANYIHVGLLFSFLWSVDPLVTVCNRYIMGKFVTRHKRQVCENTSESWLVVKFLHVDLVQQDEGAVRSVLRERFTCRILARHADIPNVVKYLGFLDDRNHSLRGLVFDFCGDLSAVQHEAQERIASVGFMSTHWADLDALPDWSHRVKTSLRSVLVFAEKRPWSVKKILSIFRKVAKALEEVHKRGYLHRDIAPRNILCDSEGNVQLADFGLAKFVGRDDDGYGDYLINTYYKHLSNGNQYALAWWAPECLASDGKIGHAEFSTDSDVYSLGILMWQCFSHRDPFDHISDPAQIVSMILDGTRPSIELLDRDTPTDLVPLIEACWSTDPDDRPSLKEVSEALMLMENQDSPKKRMRVRSPQLQQRKRWFDVCNMYQELPLPQLMDRVSEEPIGAGSFIYRQCSKRFSDAKHDPSLVNQLASALRDKFPAQPFDVFLIHTGAQKQIEVAAMKECFEAGGLRCFLDRDMNPGNGSPSEQMRFALETCRHGVVVLSQAFLGRKHPCEELAFAFDRMQWIRRQQYAWESLWVVLFDVTVSEYDESRGTRDDLPDLGGQITVLQWHSGNGFFESWPHLCHKLKSLIIQKDEIGAIKNWACFLEQHGRLHESFPVVDSLYAKY